MKTTEQLGREASYLLEDGIFQEAVQSISKQLMKDWSMSRNTEDRENIWYEVKAVERITTKLVTYVENAAMEERLKQ